MATIEQEILEAAHKDGLIGAKLSKRQQLYLKQSILTMNKLITVIASVPDGLDIEQIARRAKTHKNTCLIYTRWLAKKNYVVIEQHQLEGADGKKRVSNYRIKN